MEGKLKINASKEELESIGISRDIMEMECIFLQEYPDGWYEIEVKLEDRLSVLNVKLGPERYDIPSRWVEEITI